MASAHSISIQFDGKYYQVLGCRLADSSLGTSLRYIATDNISIHLIPFLLEADAFVGPGRLPWTINSIYAHLQYLALDVVNSYMPCFGTPEHDNPESRKKYAKDRFHTNNPEFDHEANIAILAYNEYWSGSLLTKDQIAALRHGLFELGNRTLEHSKRAKHDDLVWMIYQWKTITGHDPAMNIAFAYAKPASKVFSEAVCRTMKAKNLSEDEAKQHVFSRVNYIAEYDKARDEDGDILYVLIKDAAISVYDEKDYNLVGKWAQGIATQGGGEQVKPKTVSVAQQQAAKNRQKLPEHRNAVIRYYKKARDGRSKAEAARLTRNWMARAKENGGLGIPKGDLPSEATIMRWAGDKK